MDSTQSWFMSFQTFPVHISNLSTLFTIFFFQPQLPQRRRGTLLWAPSPGLRPLHLSELRLQGWDRDKTLVKMILNNHPCCCSGDPSLPGRLPPSHHQRQTSPRLEHRRKAALWPRYLQVSICIWGWQHTNTQVGMDSKSCNIDQSGA